MWFTIKSLITPAWSNIQSDLYRILHGIGKCAPYEQLPFKDSYLLYRNALHGKLDYIILISFITITKISTALRDSKIINPAKVLIQFPANFVYQSFPLLITPAYVDL